MVFDKDYGDIQRTAFGGGPNAIHCPVMLREVLEYLAPERGGFFIDATLGLGGHSTAILEAAPNIELLGVDRDAQALRLATERLEKFGTRFCSRQSNFSTLTQVVAEMKLPPAAGILADFGVSSLQLDAAERGFSFRFAAPLDMRMNQSGRDETVSDLLTRLSETELADVIYRFGEERQSRRIARRLVRARETQTLPTTTTELASLVAQAVGGSPQAHRIHPATRTFQALRMAVNNELQEIEVFLEKAWQLLAPGGRLVVISFHSLEDRLVKWMWRRLAGQCTCPPRQPFCDCGAQRVLQILTPRPVTPSTDEEEANPRARSAKLRAVERLAE